jgi:hypothetical protein
MKGKGDHRQIEKYEEVMLGPISRRVRVNLRGGLPAREVWEFTSFRDIQQYIHGIRPAELIELLVEGAEAASSEFESLETAATGGAVRKMIGRARQACRHMDELWALQQEKLRTPGGEKALTGSAPPIAFLFPTPLPFPENAIDGYRRLLLLQRHEPLAQEAAALFRTLKVVLDVITEDMNEDILPSLGC